MIDSNFRLFCVNELFASSLRIGLRLRSLVLLLELSANPSG